MSRPPFARRLGQAALEAVSKHRLSWALGAVAIAAIVALSSTHFVLQVGVPWGVVARPTGDLPVHVTIDGGVEVGFTQPLESTIVIRDPIHVAIDRAVTVPLDLQVDVPIDTMVMVDQVIDVAMKAPLDVVITERELQLEHLTVPIDTSVLVDDKIPIDTIVPIDSAVTSVLGLSVPVKANLPIHLVVPIKQPVHIHDTIQLAVTQLRAPLHMVVPITAKVPIKQGVHVTGEIHVPIHRTIPVTLGALSITPTPEPIHVTVALPEATPVHLTATLSPTITLPEPVQVGLDPIRIDTKDVSIGVK
jgi:hypothetical protein